MNHDIEADWQLLNTCNYRCSYCFFPVEMLGERISEGASPAAWERALADTGLVWLLHLTGGEPCVHPRFAALCAALSRRHVLSLNSNLSRPSIADFARAVEPERVAFINAGLHDLERARRGGLAIFLRNASLLLDRGFRLFVSVVATPAVLADVGRVIDTMAPTGLVPFPKMLQGRHAGATYPDDYTPEERSAFVRFNRLAREANDARMAGWPERPSIDVGSDDGLLDRIPDFRGQTCEAGRRFVRLHGDGSVFRCSTETALGNVLTGTFAPRREAAVCDTRYCFYFCRKYTDQAATCRQLTGQAAA